MKEPNAPTQAQCGEQSWIDDVSFAVWHPQWGGYSSIAIVKIDPSSNGFSCFEVWNWHDGEFPINDKKAPDRKHYCDPMQLADFSVTVMEKMAERQVFDAKMAGHESHWLPGAVDGEPSPLPVDELRGLRDRVDALLKLAEERASR